MIKIRQVRKYLAGTGPGDGTTVACLIELGA